MGRFSHLSSFARYGAPLSNLFWPFFHTLLVKICNSLCSVILVFLTYHVDIDFEFFFLYFLSHLSFIEIISSRSHNFESSCYEWNFCKSHQTPSKTSTATTTTTTTSARTSKPASVFHKTVLLFCFWFSFLAKININPRCQLMTTATLLCTEIFTQWLTHTQLICLINHYPTFIFAVSGHHPNNTFWCMKVNLNPELNIKESEIVFLFRRLCTMIIACLTNFVPSLELRCVASHVGLYDISYYYCYL